MYQCSLDTPQLCDRCPSAYTHFQPYYLSYCRDWMAAPSVVLLPYFTWAWYFLRVDTLLLQLIAELSEKCYDIRYERHTISCSIHELSLKLPFDPRSNYTSRFRTYHAQLKPSVAFAHHYHRVRLEELVGHHDMWLQEETLCLFTLYKVVCPLSVKYSCVVVQVTC